MGLAAGITVDRGCDREAAAGRDGVELRDGDGVQRLVRVHRHQSAVQALRTPQRYFCKYRDILLPAKGQSTDCARFGLPKSGCPLRP